MINIAGFIICGLVIFLAGKQLSFYGDKIAIIKGWGKAWVGLILFSAVTTLPELMVGISSSAIVGSADLAVGNIIGSCAFNLCILALMDAFTPEHKSLFSIGAQSHVMAAAMGIILFAMVGVGIFLPEYLVILPGIALSSVLFIVIYILSIRIMYSYESRRMSRSEADDPVDKIEKEPLKPVVLRYFFFALIIIAAALFIPVFADGIAEDTGLGKSFIGTLLLATSTSLPEISISIAAVRMGSVDLSIGNLLGSNIFNILILAVNDGFYTKGHILKDASDAHMTSVFAVMIMTSIAIIGLTYRTEKKPFRMGWDAGLIFLVYIINMVLLYRLTS
jgi:cation:H+ antiporter